MNIRVALAVMILLNGFCIAFGDDKPAGPVDAQAKALADWQQQLVRNFDANGDGKLSDQERFMMAEALRRNGINPGVMPGGVPGSDQFAKLSDEEKLKAMAMF